jgi:MerR family transcriptional regulator, heat shock protein HspR
MARRRDSDEEGYFLISYVARVYRVHPQTLRTYERAGLLRPSRARGNTRLYSRSDLERLETILGLTREMGVNLAGVEIVLRLRERIERLQEQILRLEGRSGVRRAR